MNRETTTSHSIVDVIRKNIQSDPLIRDQWDEEIGGAGWIHNEMDMFDDLVHLADLGAERVIPSVRVLETEFNTVDKIRQLLNIQKEWYLHSLLRFVTKGGTADYTCFELRSAKDRDAIVKYMLA